MSDYYGSDNSQPVGTSSSAPEGQSADNSQSAQESQQIGDSQSTQYNYYGITNEYASERKYTNEQFNIGDGSIGNRILHTMVNVNDDIYLYGGTSNGTDYYKDLYKISKNSEGNYVFTKIYNDISSFSNFGVTTMAFTVKNNDIYVFGIDGVSKLFKMSTFPSYDIVEISYSGNINIDIVDEIIIIQNKLYIFGGVLSGGFVSNNKLYKIDLSTNTADEIIIIGDSISSRYLSKMISIDNDIYIYGGMTFTSTGSPNFETDLYKISIDNQTNQGSSKEIIYTGDTISNRYGVSITTIGNDIYIFGGYDFVLYYNDFYRISKNGNTYENTRITYEGESITERYNSQMISINGNLFIFGGNNGRILNEFGTAGDSSKPVPDSFLYKMSTSSVTEEGMSQHISQELTAEIVTTNKFNEFISKRHGHAMTAIGNNIYIFGGADQSGYLNDFYKIDTTLDPHNDNYITLMLSDGFGNTISPRFAHTMINIGTDIYVFGGFGGGSIIYNDLYKIDTTTNPPSVEIITSDGFGGTIEPVGLHAMTKVGPDIYIFGGWGSSIFFNQLWKINTIGIPSATDVTPTLNPISTRWGHFMTSMDNDIYIFGGTTETLYGNDHAGVALNDMYKIDTTTDPLSIETITNNGFENVIPGRYTHCMIGINNNIHYKSIYIFGGVGIGTSENKYFNDFYKIRKLHLNANFTVEVITTNGFNTKITNRAVRSIVNIENDIYIFGGVDHSLSIQFNDLIKVSYLKNVNMHKLNQYKFDLTSYARLKIKYNKDTLEFVNDEFNNNLNKLIVHGLNLDTDEEIVNNQKISLNREANIKFKIPCVGYLNEYNDDNFEMFPDFFISEITSEDSIMFNGTNTYNIKENLYVKCDLFVQDDITAFATFYSSDINLKQDIIDLKNNYNIIEKLNPVNFKWKKDDKDEVGFIAQEIQEIIPIIVNDFNDYKVISETKIIAYLVGAIQELDRELKELESLKNI